MLRSLRDKVIWFAALSTTLTLIFTELASAPGVINRVTSALLAVALAIGGALWARRNLRPLPRFSHANPWGWMCGLLLIIPLGQALLFPVDYWDGLTYHLPRVLHTVQQGSLRPFATPYFPEALMPQLAEILAAHVFVLFRSEIGLQLIAWTAFALTGLALSIVSRELGGSTATQWITALLFFLLPTAFRQASAPKNDMLLTLWFCCALVALARLRTPHHSVHDVALFWMACALMFLTKGTSLAFGAPLIAFYAFAFKPVGTRLVWAKWLAPAVATLLIAPHLYRVLSAVGWAPSLSSHYQNEELSLHGLASNASRTIAMLMALPVHPINSFISSCLAQLHAALDWDISDVRFSVLPWQMRWHDAAPIHVATAGAAAVIAWRPTKSIRWLIVIALCAFGLHSLLVRWQPFGRLVLPPLALSAVWIAAALQSLPRVATTATLGLAALVYLPHLVSGEHSLRRIAIARTDAARFVNFPEFADTLSPTVAYVQGRRPKVIALLTAPAAPEAPFITRLWEVDPNIRFEHRLTGHLEFLEDRAPVDLVLAFWDDPGELHLDGRHFTRTQNFGRVHILEPQQ